MSDRKPLFWILYAVLSAAALALAIKLFPLAIPIVHLDITMTREAAVAQARLLATKLKIAPEGARDAIVFNQDGKAQNYVELDGGGKEAFARLVEGDLYAPYWWDVRLFKPGVIEEATIQFRPDGRVNGFSRRVPETYVRDEATKALAPDAALALARERAAADWGVDFAPYELLDQSQQTQPSGRVDHRFVFERAEALREARIRLELEVSGDELTGVNPFVHVPEAFARRFEEMRSANNSIANVASIVAGVLYGLGGCVMGTLWLLRRKGLALRSSLLAGLAVGALLGAAVLSSAPAAWYVYSTAQEESSFWVRQSGLALAALVGGGLMLGVAFMAAEGLTRHAFPHHPQIWKVWSRDAAPTAAIAGRTAGGYLFVPIELAFVALFYLLTNRYLGWWQPSEQLTDPNILASAVPALSPISASLQAGMMEECVFRGIPIALGALIGARFGRRGLGIGIAVVVQALVFGSAHANYPGFPSYSRMVELILPSLAWAAIFLRYGLLPTMLLHALFDLVLMSIPIFLVDAPGASLQRGLVIFAGAVPLLVILARRLQAGAWLDFPERLRNGAWQGRAPAPVAAEPDAVVSAVDARASRLQRYLPLLGLAGLAAWVAFTPLVSDAPPLALGRDAALSLATEALGKRGVTLDSSWQRMAVTRSALEDGSQRQWHGFVWREAGPEAYRALVGNALAPPVWDVRFARFDGDVAERAEEWRVSVTGDGRIRQVVHRLPEARAGATLTREDAQAIAEKALRDDLGLDAHDLVSRGAESFQRKSRLDWLFAWADPRVKVGESAEARVQVAIAGNEVASAGRSLFIPEAWQRAEVQRDDRRQILRIAAVGLVAFSAIAALVFAVIAWSKGRCDRRTLVGVAVLIALVVIVGSANTWPSQAFGLRTAEPVANQVLVTVLGVGAAALFASLLIGLLAGVGMHYARRHPPVRIAGRLPVWACGVMAALATAGIGAALGALVSGSMPMWPELKHESAWSPLLAAAMTGLALVPGVAITLFLLSVFDRATAGWTRRLALVAIALILLSAAASVVSGRDPSLAVLEGAIEGATTFAFAWLLLRYDLRTVPAFAATGMVLATVREAMLAGTASAWTATAVTTIVVIAAAWAASRALRQEAS